MEEAIDLKLLFLVLAGGNEIHKLDENFQRNSWPSRSNPDAVLWIKSGNSEYFDVISRTLYVNTSETDLLGKTIRAIRWALHNTEFDCLVRTNVSTYFDTLKLKSFLEKQRFSSKSYGGYLNLCAIKNSNDKETFITGTGIFLGREVAEFIVGHFGDQLVDTPDDVAISRILFQCDFFSFVRIPRLNLPSHHIFYNHFYIRCKSSWNDFAAHQRFILIDKYHSSKDFLGRFSKLFKIYIFELTVEPRSFSNFKIYLGRIKSDLLYYLINRNPNMILRQKEKSIDDSR